MPKHMLAAVHTHVCVVTRLRLGMPPCIRQPRHAGRAAACHRDILDGQFSLGDGAPLAEGDVVGRALAAEDMFRFSSLNPRMGATIRQLAALSPRTLALMHGPSFGGDGAGALRAPAADYDRGAQRTADPDDLT